MILFTIADVIINPPSMCAKSYPQRFTQAVIISWKHLQPIYWKNLLAEMYAFSSNKNMYSRVNIWSVPMTKCGDEDLHLVLRRRIMASHCSSEEDANCTLFCMCDK